MIENAPVLQTQVVDQIATLSRAGLRTALITTAIDRGRFDRLVGEPLRAAGTSVRLVRHGGRLGNLLRMARAVRAFARGHQIGRAYARGIWGPVVLRLATAGRPIPFVYDVRGSLVDETRGAKSAGWKARIFAGVERWSIRRAARVTAVSTPLAEQIAVTHGRRDVDVIPSCVHTESMSVSDEKRLCTREQLGVADDDIVLLYSGGLDYYQQIPSMLELWRLVADEPDVRFLLLTNTAPTHAIGDGIGAMGESVQRLSVSRAEISRYLGAADIGFMLRDRRLLNRVASPVKFAEYLAAGLAVVASPGTGDISALVAAHDIGVLVDPEDVVRGAESLRVFLKHFRANRAAIRRRARLLAEARYDWDAYLPVYRDLYTGSPQAQE